MSKSKKTILLLSIIIVAVVGLAIFNYVMNKYSVPSKEERKKNMLAYQEKTEMDANDIADEISYALEKYTNWDNLFLSEKFKSKFKNKKGIIGNTWNIENIDCHSAKPYGMGDVIVITVNYRNGFFNDETDAVSTEFYYEYGLDANNEIDDLILKDKRNIYTFNGDRY